MVRHKKKLIWSRKPCANSFETDPRLCHLSLMRTHRTPSPVDIATRFSRSNQNETGDPTVEREDGSTLARTFTDGRTPLQGTDDDW